MADIDLSVSASLANLEAQLAQVRDLTADQAKLIVKDLQASIRAAEKASKESAAATKKAMQDTQRAAEKASAATADVGDKFGKVGSSAGKVAGVLDLLVPGLGGAARGVRVRRRLRSRGDALERGGCRARGGRRVDGRGAARGAAGDAWWARDGARARRVPRERVARGAAAAGSTLPTAKL